MFKKIATCALLCGVFHNAISMDYVTGTVKLAVSTAGNVYNSAADKLNPTSIFDEIRRGDWNKASENGKQTLLHRMHRGFTKGYLKENQLTSNILDAVDDVIPQYPISTLVLERIHKHIKTRLSTLDARSVLFFRALKSMYRIYPSQLAPDITNRTFLNYLSNANLREEVVNTIAEIIVLSGKITEANDLVSALREQPDEVTFGTTAQKLLFKFLEQAMLSSAESCDYIERLGNAKSEDSKKVADAKARIKLKTTRAQAALEAITKDEQTLQPQLDELALRSAQLAAQKAEQERAALALQAEQHELALKNQELERMQRELNVVQAYNAKQEQILVQELEAAGIAKAAAAQLIAESQQAQQAHMQAAALPAQASPAAARLAQPAAAAQQQQAGRSPTTNKQPTATVANSNNAPTGNKK
ncbi:MAG: hypothetical protein AB7F19_04455 [Candidatus Babeliales bacterium]